MSDKKTTPEGTRPDEPCEKPAGESDRADEAFYDFLKKTGHSSKTRVKRPFHVPSLMPSAVSEIASIKSHSDLKMYFSKHTISALLQAFCEMEVSFTRIIGYLADLVEGAASVFKEHQLGPLTPGRSIHVDRLQAATLLACMFFGLFKDESLSFVKMFSSRHPAKVEFCKCLIHYFDTVSRIPRSDLQAGSVIFEKVRASDRLFPSKKPTTLLPIVVDTKGSVEDCKNAWIADFANSSLGGGVLGSFGSVQEEILFITHPECITAMLYCDNLTDWEAVHMKGCARYSTFTGYRDTFKFTGGKPRETQNIVAFDALDLVGERDQYTAQAIDREIRKCYAAANGAKQFATGNWGCGAFKGDVHLKALLQWIGTSCGGATMVYHTYGNEDLGKFLCDISEKYSSTDVDLLRIQLIKVCNLDNERIKLLGDGSLEVMKHVLQQTADTKTRQ
eukprot:TRINITY_DN10011_c0_g5_i1.p1 TRINITY_DN10011_c0_g5~~TRINITY_DN10011_c0_g5_i1.p1  ORF type:complete len:473 (+),score=118.32 TRINITY_DN10011_c0_g5_i1:80-1420(+)